MRLTHPSWVRVEIDGVAKMEGEFPSGTTRSFVGTKSAGIRVGDAGGVDVVVNGKDMGLLGSSGAVVDKVFKLGGG